ncbi:hypothetical protein [Micromonospora zhanjiangensis]
MSVADPAPNRPTDRPAVAGTPAGAASGPAVGRAPIVAGLKERALGDNRKKWLIGALAAVLLIALLVIVPLVNSGSDDGTKPGAGQPSNTPGTSNSAPPATSAAPSTGPTSAAPAPPPSPTAPAKPPVPAGWTLHKDSLNAFTIPVPNGWTRSVASQDTVIFNGPGGRLLLVQWTPTPAGDPYNDWHKQEPARKFQPGVQNYRYLSINRVPGYFKSCADWDWLQTKNGADFHVRNRGVVTAKNRAYGIRYEVPESEWKGKEENNFLMLTANFDPDRKD